MKRYSIRGRRHGEPSESVICECDSNPEPLAHIAAMKRIPLGIVGKRMAYTNKYVGVRVIDHEQGTSWSVKYDD
jgi:hypothetical protein